VSDESCEIAGVEIVRFTDGNTRHEVWQLAGTAWDDWAACVDRFLAHAIGAIVAAYPGEPVEWLEINHWPHSGRLIVFPSQNGPDGNRDERVCFELSSAHLELAAQRDGHSHQVWTRVSACLLHGAAGQALTAAQRSHRLRVAGYDYNPGEGLWWLEEDGLLREGRAS
jgi:hypothetical protein